MTENMGGVSEHGYYITKKRPRVDPVFSAKAKYPH
jgi:hypothetical protein